MDDRAAGRIVVRETVVASTKALIEGHGELAESLPEEAFAQTLDTRSNAIGEQFWCVVGARESYVTAIENDGWSGFSCSLKASEVGSKQAIADALRGSALTFDRAVAEVVWTGVRDEMLLALLEHEAQHQGQLIRYVYAHGYSFPQSWINRWALTE